MREFFRRHRFLILGLALLVPGLWFASHQAVLAQGAVSTNEILNSEIGQTIGTGTQDIRITIAKIIRVVFGILGTIALLLILYAGFLWMTSAGDDTKVAAAKKTMTAAIIGLVIMLSAYGIVSFVINSLVNATVGAGDGVGGDGGGGGGGGGFGGSGGAFRPTAIQPGGSLAKYDVFAAVTFSAAPTSDIVNIRANLRLEKAAGSSRTVVEYEPVVENNTIRLRPITPCPSPNADRRCLEPNSDYQITVSSGLKNASGANMITCGLGAVCTRSFRTGDAVTTQPPTVVIYSPTDGQSVPTSELVPIQAILTDENGIATVEYSVDGAFFSADGNAQSIAPSAYSSQTFLETALYAPVRSVALRVRVINIDGDEATSDDIHVTVRPKHCFNAVKDGDETAVDCGGSCGACTGGACTDNGACASSLCAANRCVENPQITDIQSRDGKPGNLVTITGVRFGSLPGKVVFLGAAGDTDDQEADLAACADSWADARIIIAVPAGAVTGPIEVTASGGKKDATNDALGPIIADFQVNDTARPGICAVSPNSIKTGQTLSVTGRAFGTSQSGSRVQFVRAGSDCSQIQDWNRAAEAAQVSSWTETALSPTVPNVETGASWTNYLLRVLIDGQSSNAACIRVEPPEAGTEPRIDYLTPVKGSVGTYLTVFGANFGSGGTVHFRNSEGDAVGDISFPAQCAVGYWTNASVTVKVPARFTTPVGTAMSLGAHEVTVVRSDGRVSNASAFTLNTDPMPPGICRINPDNGPVGITVSLYGDGFGDVAAADLPVFTALHPDAIRFHENKNAASVGQWQTSSITASVPATAVSGPVSVRTFVAAGPLESNSANFQVRDCNEAGGDAVCGGGRACCDDGACRASCGAAAAIGGFAWQFSTGPIPVFPIVLENATCQLSAPSSTPSPNPYKGATDVCTDIGAMTVRFSLPMDLDTLRAGTNVALKACGTGSAMAPCDVTVPVAVPALQPGDSTTLSISTPAGGLAADTWYRLTVSDLVRSIADLPTRAAQQLDGDFDSRGGGAYVTTFKTGAGPCVIAGVDLIEDDALIDDADQTEAYGAYPLSERCINLSCAGRTASWSSDPAKATVVPGTSDAWCPATAAPVSETDPGPPTVITATVDGFTDTGELTIDYANPRVTEYGPRDCDQACVNTVAFARFNTAMKKSDVENPDNVRMYRCLNESCLAYVGGPMTLHLEYLGDSSQPNGGARLLKFNNPELAPDTFYRVSVLGTVRSTSDAPLTGLNFEDVAFSWIFRTRQSANPCGPQNIQIEPAQTTLHYITEAASITALPRSSKDACAVDGQILAPNSFNWSWAKSQVPAAPIAFHYLPDAPPGTILNTDPDLPAGCSSSCLMTGSKPLGTTKCGDGAVETGEACDTPNLSGCNNSCQRTGNTESGVCGNGNIQPDHGEECDLGPQNGAMNSGCSAACLFTGSVAGISVCGNGSVGLGEACDDGNTASGDGCGAVCTLEGSSKDVFVCGNGKLELGEQCEYESGPAGLGMKLLIPSLPPLTLGATYVQNPALPGFACSPSCLLRGNTAACQSGEDCCGNGKIEYSKGEGCDAGIGNGDPASGCSSACTKTGSHPGLRAYCGNGGVPEVKPPAGLIQNGGGEDCEVASVIDSNVDPLQVIEALNRCDAGNSCVASVTASIGSVSGKGDVSVECSCRIDSDCSAFGLAAGKDLSCGAGACCYERPAKPVIRPNGGNACRNALVTVTFGEEMNEGSLQEGIVVESCTGLTAGPESGNWFVRTFDAVGRFLKSLVGVPATAAVPHCDAVAGTFQHTTDSQVTAFGTTTYTVSKFAPDKLYDESHQYRVTVRGGATGVKTVKGVGYPTGDDTTQKFTTGTNICDFDVVEMDPAKELIQTADTPLTINATAMTDRGGLFEPIAPIPGVYDWTWSWSNIPEATPPGKVLDVTAASDPSAIVQAKKATNGREQVVATAIITADTILTPRTVGMSKTGISVITVMLCEQPWPRRGTGGVWSPYVDPATHFEFYYCRDNAGAALPEIQAAPIQGQSGSGNSILRFCKVTKDHEQPKACVSDADCNVSDQCLSKDAFFLFDPVWKLSDVIGVRVYDNPNRLTPQEWYAAQNFSGKTQSATVDGYMAIQAERTVYVGAVDKYGDPELRSYMYVFVYNERADSRTAEVFNRLVKNVRYNTNLVPSDRVTNVCKTPGGQIARVGDPSAPPTVCSSDLDCFAAFPNPPAGLACDADKDKIRRDMRRWQDMRGIEAALEDARQSSGSYPKLESGSFLRGFTNSLWPSWSQQMGAVGAFKDPLNGFNRCESFGSECTISRTACAADGECHGGTGDVCRTKFEASTCYDDRASVFACPVASRVYQYRSIGGDDYLMNVGFEYTAYPWTHSDCALKPGETVCEDAVGCSWAPTGPGTGSCKTRISTVSSCSGMFGSSSNKCLATGVDCTQSSACAANDSCVPKGVSLFGPAAGAVCGNGLIESGELCEIGASQAVSCGAGQGSRGESCNNTCTGWDIVQACPGAASCGNGSLETFAGETCDDGPQNGQYGRCRKDSLGCAKHCVKISKRPAFDGICSDGSCDLGVLCKTNADCGGAFPGSPAVCTDRMNFCGDGIKNGPELCDDGAQNGEYGKCAWDCRGAGPRCGDLQTNGGEKCDGNQQAASGVCIESAASLDDSAPIDGLTQACSRDADCGAGKKCALCKLTLGGLPQTRAKSCLAATVLPPQAACTFDLWSKCQPSGACGNGKVEGAEQCDLGTGNSTTGECLPTCKRNICNDGFVRTGTEQCDNGAANGVLCLPKYGLTCNYCDNACAIKTLTGGFCGDSAFQNSIASPPGPESCEPGPVSGWCSRTYKNPADNSGVKGCTSDSGCKAGTCKRYVGTTPLEELVACHSAADCAADDFCNGGQGQCISYNTRCVPEPYSNTAANPASPRYVDGACTDCSNSCVGAITKSPNFCGDDIVQTRFGEQCEGIGDVNATLQTGSRYDCAPDCGWSGGFCGDNIVQTPKGETCDQGSGLGTITAGQIRGKVTDTVRRTGIPGLKIQLWSGSTLKATAFSEADGTYAFTGINTPNSCKVGYRIVFVHEDKPYTKLIGTTTVTLTPNGYFEETAPASGSFGFRCAIGPDIQSISGQIIQMKETKLIPKLRPYERLIVVEWDGSLGGNYLDLHLRLPDASTGLGTYYASSGNTNVDIGTHSTLSCFDLGAPISCNSFEFAAETTKFRFANDAGTKYYSAASNKFRAWLVDYNCGGSSSSNTKTGCSTMRNRNLTVSLYGEAGLIQTVAQGVGTIGPLTNGYWEIFSMDKNGVLSSLNKTSSTLPDNVD